MDHFLISRDTTGKRWICFVDGKELGNPHDSPIEALHALIDFCRTSVPIDGSEMSNLPEATKEMDY